MTKEKEIKSQPASKASEEGKVFKDLIQGMVRLEPPKIIEEISQTPVADSILEPSIKPSKRKEEPQMAELENKILIYGNNSERDCYWEKIDCGFSIYHEVKQYRNKLTPQKKRVGTARYPIDF